MGAISGGRRGPEDARGQEGPGQERWLARRQGGWGEAYEGCGTEAYGESRRHGGNIQL